MAKTILITLMAVVVSVAAQPLVYGSPYYSYGGAYPAAAYTAAYSVPPVTAAALPAATLPAATIPATAYATAFNGLPLSALSAYPYSLQDPLAPAVVNPAAASFVLGSPYASYAPAEYIYGR